MPFCLLFGSSLTLQLCPPAFCQKPVQSGDVLVAIAGLLGGVHIRDRQGPGHFFKMSR